MLLTACNAHTYIVANPDISSKVSRHSVAILSRSHFYTNSPTVLSATLKKSCEDCGSSWHDGAPYLQTIKLNKWELPDLRKDGAPIPHNHPWPFRGKLLKGGYMEDRYEVDFNRDEILADPYQKWEVGGASVASGVVHQAGEVNDLPLTTFHEVTEILEPGTLSMMDCDLGRKEGWGHLEDDGKGNLVYIPNKLGELDTRFMPRMLELNPHRRR